MSHRILAISGVVLLTACASRSGSAGFGGNAEGGAPEADASPPGCPPGERMCNASAGCIPEDTCCTSADCSTPGQTGQVCPEPGAACQCPDGERMCPGLGACISSGACCTSADCAGLAGSSCNTPGQACQCVSGEKPCLAMGWCIPEATCCPIDSCPPFARPRVPE